MEPDQERFEAWLHSAQPVCKSPWVCWQAGLESSEETRHLVATTQSEDAFEAWHAAVMAGNIDVLLFDAYRAAINWGHQYVGDATAMQPAPEGDTQLDAVRTLRI